MIDPTSIRVIGGGGRDTDRATALRTGLIDAIEAHGAGMSVAAVVGTLHILAHEISAQWEAQEDD